MHQRSKPKKVAMVGVQNKKTAGHEIMDEILEKVLMDRKRKRGDDDDEGDGVPTSNKRSRMDGDTNENALLSQWQIDYNSGIRHWEDGDEDISKWLSPATNHVHCVKGMRPRNVFEDVFGIGLNGQRVNTSNYVKEDCEGCYHIDRLVLEPEDASPFTPDELLWDVGGVRYADQTEEGFVYDSDYGWDESESEEDEYEQCEQDSRYEIDYVDSEYYFETIVERDYPFDLEE